jgi:hypothetical protein
MGCCVWVLSLRLGLIIMLATFDGVLWFGAADLEVLFRSGSGEMEVAN